MAGNGTTANGAAVIEELHVPDNPPKLTAAVSEHFQKAAPRIAWYSHSDEM